MLRCTNAREPATQVCPAAAKIPASSPALAWAKSASGNTIFADLPPNSRVTCAMRRAAPPPPARPPPPPPSAAILAPPPSSNNTTSLFLLPPAGESNLGNPARVDEPLCRFTPTGHDIQNAAWKSDLLGQFDGFDD